MIRIHRFPISVATYHARGKRNVFPDIDDCPQPDCPYRGRLWRHGFYCRRAITLTAVFTIVIQRYLCPMCGRTVSLLPSFLAPRFQYTLGALLWLLRAVGVAGRSTRDAVEAWRAEGGCPELNRQHVQFLLRRLERQAGVCRSLLGVGEEAPIAVQLAERVLSAADMKEFAERVWIRWQRPFLASSAL